jgi:hypothetical protein
MPNWRTREFAGRFFQPPDMFSLDLRQWQLLFKSTTLAKSP